MGSRRHHLEAAGREPWAGCALPGERRRVPGFYRCGGWRLPRGGGYLSWAEKDVGELGERQRRVGFTEHGRGAREHPGCGGALGPKGSQGKLRVCPWEGAADPGPAVQTVAARGSGWSRELTAPGGSEGGLRPLEFTFPACHYQDGNPGPGGRGGVTLPGSRPLGLRASLRHPGARRPWGATRV